MSVITRAPAGTVDSALLRKAIARVKFACAKHSALDVFRGVKVSSSGDRLELECSNAETSARTWLDWTSVDDCADLDVIVGLAELVTAITGKGPIGIMQSAGELRPELQIVRGATVQTIGALRAEDWLAPDYSAGELLHVGEGSRMSADVARIAIAASSDLTRPILTGIQLQNGEMVSTDSYRLHYGLLYGEPQSETAVIIPAGELTSALKGSAGTVSIEIRGNRTVIVRGLDREVTIRALDGQYPNFRQLVPDTWTGSLELRRSELLELTSECVRLAGRKGNSPGARPLELTIGAETIACELHIPDGPTLAGEVSIDRSGELAHEDTRIGIASEYLRDALATVGDSAIVQLDYISPLRPILISADGAWALLMPVRLNV